MALIHYGNHCIDRHLTIPLTGALTVLSSYLYTDFLTFTLTLSLTFHLNFSSELPPWCRGDVPLTPSPLSPPFRV